MRVATHDGSFHADDVFAVATLSLVDAALQIVRTRDEDLQASCDLRVDVGWREDAASGDFDHHQRGGAGERPNGVRYASFGLVWRHYGERICGGDPDVAEWIDRSLVQGIDAHDNGQRVSAPLIDDLEPMTVSRALTAYNPLWDEDDSPAEGDRRFGEAVALAGRILAREVAAGAAHARAAALVADAIGRAADPRLIELDRDLPWHRAVVTGAPEALFVIYPKTSAWGLRAVPRELGDFANRRDLPAAWAGLSGAGLVAATGVGDAVFCHSARFMAVAGSREGITALARLALAAG